MLSGNTDGSIIAYDLLKCECLGVFPAHFDSIGAISINQVTGLLATGSGQRHYQDEDISDSTSEE